MQWRRKYPTREEARPTEFQKKFASLRNANNPAVSFRNVFLLKSDGAKGAFMRTADLVTLVGLIWIGAGCQTADFHQAYPGAPLPAEETCMLRVPAILDVQSIDGVPTEWSLRFKKSEFQELSLVAGNHHLLVRYNDPTADESRQEMHR